MSIAFPMVTTRLMIRPFTPDDIPAIHGVYGDPEVMRYVGAGSPTANLAESAAMVELYIQHNNANGYGFWALLDRATETVIGDIGFEQHEEGTEFGYTLGRMWWGRGLATEAANLCVAQGFTNLDLQYLIGVVDPLNHGSSRVLDKLGFEFRRERLAYDRPHHEYILAADDWHRRATGSA